MSPLVRRVRAVLVGLCVGVIIIMAIEALSSRVFPMPSRVDPNDKEAMRAAIAARPFGALLFVLAAWGFGTLAGVFTATLIDRTPSRVPAFVVGAALFLGAVITMIAIPHPTWFTVIAVLMFAPMALLGHRLALGRVPAPA
jgi:hypothetical protein